MNVSNRQMPVAEDDLKMVFYSNEEKDESEHVFDMLWFKYYLLQSIHCNKTSTLEHASNLPFKKYAAI